jgi:hypothetical protein
LAVAGVAINAPIILPAAPAKQGMEAALSISILGGGDVTLTQASSAL